MCNYFSLEHLGEDVVNDDDVVEGENQDENEDEVRVDAEQPNREEFLGDMDTSDEEEEGAIANIPSETEHLIIIKYCVDGKELCSHCAIHYCRQNGREKFDSHFSHDVVHCLDVRAIYNVHKCDICSLGLIRVLGRNNCPICDCNACNALNFPEKCDECKRSRIKFFHRVKEWVVDSLTGLNL